LLERAWRNQPALRQILLIKMLHSPSPFCVTHAEALQRAKSRERTWTFWIY
jgi:hypothetical protein